MDKKRIKVRTMKKNYDYFVDKQHDLLKEMANNKFSINEMVALLETTKFYIIYKGIELNKKGDLGE
jgi:hypothetical protein